jgi:hypothetical protein
MSKQERYDKNQKEGGNVKVCTWVPEPFRGNLLKYAAKLRKRKTPKTTKL